MSADIEKNWTLDFPVERVFAAWTSSETVIPPATAMDIEPRVGGHYRLIVDDPQYRARCEGTFSRFETNRRVSYSWQWEGHEEVTQIDVRFTATDAGGTHIQLTHSGFGGEESRGAHDAGWDSYIAGFTRYLERA